MLNKLFDRLVDFFFSPFFDEPAPPAPKQKTMSVIAVEKQHESAAGEFIRSRNK